MKKIIRLTESDLVRLVKRVINEQNNDPKNIKTSDNEDWKSKLESYESKMDDFLRQLKDSGTEIDKKRFLKKVQKETDAMYWEVYDNSASAPEGFVELQLDLIKRFRQKLKESDLTRIVKRVINESKSGMVINLPSDAPIKDEKGNYLKDDESLTLYNGDENTGGKGMALYKFYLDDIPQIKDIPNVVDTAYARDKKYWERINDFQIRLI